MKCNPQAVIKVAEAEIGYKEKATNNQLYDKNANVGTNNWNKYANDIDTKYLDFYNGRKNGYDWCDVFVDWCFIQAYGVENAQRLLCQPDNSLGAGCEYSYNYFKQNGQTGSSPKKGAQIFFGDLDHTGIVVDYDNNYVWTVEGNSGNEVKKKKYARNNSWIYGYGYPNYDEEMPTPTPAPSGNTWTGGFPKLPSRGYYLTGDGYERYENLQPDIKLIQEFLQWVFNLDDDEFPVDGFYGEMTTAAVKSFQRLVGIEVDGSYGKDTLAAAKAYRKDSAPEPSGNVVKASQQAMEYDENLAGTYIVDSYTGLNVRDGAGMNYEILVAIPDGQKVHNYGYYTDCEGIRWLYIAFLYENINYIGFASADWLKK